MQNVPDYRDSIAPRAREETQVHLFRVMWTSQKPIVPVGHCKLALRFRRSSIRSRLSTSDQSPVCIACISSCSSVGCVAHPPKMHSSIIADNFTVRPYSSPRPDSQYYPDTAFENSAQRLGAQLCTRVRTGSDACVSATRLVQRFLQAARRCGKLTTRRAGIRNCEPSHTMVTVLFDLQRSLRKAAYPATRKAATSSCISRAARRMSNWPISRPDD